MTSEDIVALFRRTFRFVDGRCDTVNVEDSGKNQPAEPGTDDRDWVIHPASFVVGNPCRISCREVPV
jgi:hypothetical protein